MYSRVIKDNLSKQNNDLRMVAIAYGMEKSALVCIHACR